MQDKNLSVMVYESIKRLLIGLHFPPGASLRERGLAEMLGVSRTPIREAMQRLAHEGWVVLGDGKRIQVCPVTNEDVEEIFQIREIIEPSAAHHAIENGEMRVLAGSLDGILSNMREVQKNQLAFIKLDLQFHSAFIERMHNKRINRLWLVLHEEIVRIGLMTLQIGDRFSAVINEHSQMVDALWDRDEKSVMNSITEHLVRSKKSLLTKLKNNDEDLSDRGLVPVEDMYRMPDDL